MLDRQSEIDDKIEEILYDMLDDPASIAEAMHETYLPAVKFARNVTKGQISDGQRELIVKALKSNTDKDDLNCHAWSIIKNSILRYLTPDESEAIEELEK